MEEERDGASAAASALVPRIRVLWLVCGSSPGLILCSQERFCSRDRFRRLIILPLTPPSVRRQTQDHRVCWARQRARQERRNYWCEDDDPLPVNDNDNRGGDDEVGAAMVMTEIVSGGVQGRDRILFFGGSQRS